MPKKTLRDIEVKGMVCLVRVDYNVPVNTMKEITDDTRIIQTLPTLHNLIGRGAKIVLISHLGRPKDKEMSLSLAPVAKRLSEILGKENTIPLYDIDNEKETKDAISKMGAGDVLMLENIRFYDAERKDFMSFGKRLASFGDIFVNDAFGTSHRIHGSTVGITEHLPSVAGFLMESEIKYMSMVLHKPARPLVAIIGGKKASTKITVIDKLMEKADALLIGGGVANTFLKTWGLQIGKSVYEKEMVDLARKLIWKAMQTKTALLLPEDVVIANGLSPSSRTKIVDISEVPEDWMILDIGPKTVEKYREVLSVAGSVVWSGPMGLFEMHKYRAGNDAILKAVVDGNANSLVGGGDTIASIQGNDYMKQISHISTGGGATLEFIEKGTLPGIEALDKL